MSTTEKKTSNTEDVDAQIKALKDDVATLTRTLKEIGESKTLEARDAAYAKAQDVVETSNRAIRATQARAEDATATFEEQIAEKPLQSAMIALGIGVALGWLSRR